MNEDNDFPIEHKTPPTTVREVGIHLIYISKEMAEIKKTIAQSLTSFATKGELADAVEDRRRDQDTIVKSICDVEKRTTKIENIFNGIIYKIAGTAVVFLVLLILSFYGIEKYLK